MEIVSNGGNPNEDFGKGRFNTETNLDTIKISSINLKNIIPLTDEEKALLDDGIDVSVRLRVSESKQDVSKEDQKLINDALEDNKIAMFLDVSLFKKIGDNDEEKLSVLTNKMELSVELDDKFINEDDNIERVYGIIRTHEGKAEYLDAIFDAKTNTLTFETDRFSSYALVYKDIEKNPEKEEQKDQESKKDKKPKEKIDNPETSDTVGLSIMLLFGSTIGLFLLRKFYLNKN